MAGVTDYGRFLVDEGCFELTAEPPRKWRNCHYNKVADVEMYMEVSNLGDGFTRIREADGTTIMLGGWDTKYVYIRDDESGVVFNPWGAPVHTPVTDRVCRFYREKTEISSTCQDLRVNHRVFVPRDEPVEVWTTTVRNLSSRRRKVSIFAYVMFQLTGNDREGRGLWKDNFSEVLPEVGGVMVTNRAHGLPSDRFKGYLIALEGFRGGNGYRDQFTRSEFSLSTPKILWGWNCDNRGWYGPDCAGVVQVTLEIEPHAAGRADYVIGQCSSVADIRAIRARLSPSMLDAMCEEQGGIEKQRAAKFVVETGEKNRDRDALLNLFAKKQCYLYLIDKSGFRDNMQVDNAIALFDPQTATENVVKALGAQKPDGQVLHSFRPLNRHQYSDKPAWILHTVSWLIKETGDHALLERKVPFFESAESASVWEHVKRAYRFLAHDLGKHGLCDQHFADWNDGLEPSPETGARESVMVSQQLCFGLLEVEELARRIGDTTTAQECARLYGEMKAKINDVAWDGQWYKRTLCETGPALGSKELAEGKIFINTQSWAVLSKVAEGDRACGVMDMVEKYCSRPVGYVICDPPMSRYDSRIGKFSTTMPGHAENGGCYNHAAGFKVVADCMLGRAEHAWDTFVKVAPGNPQNPISQSMVEPFSFTNMYETIPYMYGYSGYPWRTGTAGWFTVAVVEWILGARRGYDGLVIDPCLTKRIPKAYVRRTFRGAIYDIHLDNSAGRCKGARGIVMDGKRIEGNVLPLASGTHRVDAEI